MGEETNAYDPAGSQFGDDVTAERPTDGRPNPVRRRKPRHAPPSRSNR